MLFPLFPLVFFGASSSSLFWVCLLGLRGGGLGGLVIGFSDGLTLAHCLEGLIIGCSDGITLAHCLEGLVIGCSDSLTLPHCLGGLVIVFLMV